MKEKKIAWKVGMKFIYLWQTYTVTKVRGRGRGADRYVYEIDCTKESEPDCFGRTITTPCVFKVTAIRNHVKVIQ